jgi:hypothetical protein
VVASFSPELFLDRRGRAVLTSPIKGTAPLSADPRDLESSRKDQAENTMIVDLMRNDLSRVCLPGSVQVPSRARAEARTGVWHLIRDISSTLQEDTASPADGDGTSGWTGRYSTATAMAAPGHRDVMPWSWTTRNCSRAAARRCSWSTMAVHTPRLDGTLNWTRNLSRTATTTWSSHPDPATRRQRAAAWKSSAGWLA